MDPSEIFTLDFFISYLLVPVVMLSSGWLLGSAANARIKLLAASEKISDDSVAGIFITSLRGLPKAWGIGVGLYFAVQSVAIPHSAQQLISSVIFSIIVFSVMTVVQRALRHIIEASSSGAGAASTSLLTNLVCGIVYSVGAIIVLDYYGISITPIVTALGVGGMAVALGLQETMANIFAGLHLLIWKQVRIGDHIRMESGAEGEIADITWRYAKLHTVTNNVIVVPNSKLASAITTNYDMPVDTSKGDRVEDVFFSLTVGVAYSSDLDFVERVTLEEARSVLGRMDPALNISEGSTTAPSVRFHTFGDSSIDFNVNLHTTSFSRQALIKHEFIKALKKRYDAEGIEIPFPVRTVLINGGTVK